MKFKKRFIWLGLAVLLYSIWAVNSASAHALLLRSNPAVNAVLEKAPIQVELFFSEPLEPGLSSVQVINSQNLRVDAGDIRIDAADPTRMTVSLHSLANGVYTVKWTALSTIDGHQTVGAFPFAVGDENAAVVNAIDQSTTARLPFSSLLAKFFFLVSMTILIGGRLFTWLVWEPALKANQEDGLPPSAWAVIHRGGLILLLFSIGFGTLAQAGQTTGREFAFPWEPEMGSILIETRLGMIWLLRLTFAILLVWLAGRKKTRMENWIGFAASLVLLLTVTLTSHAATEVRPLLPILSDFLHLVGMTFWLGGLVFLFTGVRSLQILQDTSRTKLTSLLAARFSVNALLFVSLIGLTGFYSAWLRVGSWPALLTSLYGHVLLVKQVFVAGLLLLAGMNLFIISPRLHRARLGGAADLGLVARFGKILAIDLVLAGFLLASVSFLTYVPPARVVIPNSDLTRKTKVDDLRLELSISPGRVGQNTFTLKALTSNGEPLYLAREVLLRFTPLQGNIPPSELELIGRGDGTFTARGAYLSLPGNWQVQAVVRREDMFDAYANFDFAVPGSRSGEEAFSTSKQTGLLFLLIGLFSILLFTSIPASIFLRVGVAVPLALLTMALGIFQLTRPVSMTNAQANPIPPSDESTTTGRNLFITHCSSCHGETGKGDGPVGLTLNPRPADLTQHAIPGVHTDAQLFEWISNGFPGSLMPQFKAALSETDRWHLVNFIRTLAPK